jgi:hypothetical protein
MRGPYLTDAVTKLLENKIVCATTRRPDWANVRPLCDCLHTLGRFFFKLHDIGLLYSMLTYGFKLTLAILGLGNYFTNQSGHSD